MIQLIGVKKSYNAELVLKGIDLTVADGEFLSVMGKSGSGKSTLIHILGGFLRPDEGSVLWDGEEINAFGERETSRFRCTRLGFMFQSFRLISTLTAEENVLLPACLAGEEAHARMEELFARLGLDGMQKKYPALLSGGQQQRVALARALITRPPALILDEPTGALDTAMQSRVMELLREVNAQGTTVVQVTHSPEMAACGSRTVHITDGLICG